MALPRSRSHGFVAKALSAGGVALVAAASAKKLYDVGRHVHEAVRLATSD
jgi:ribosomal protein L34